MQSVNYTRFSPKQQYLYPSHATFGLPSNNLSSRYVVAPSGIIHGNFHDPNNWSYNITREVHPYGVYLNSTSSGFLTTYEGSFGGNSNPMAAPAWDRTLVYNRALERLNAKVRGGLDLAIDLAEAGQTQRMIRGLANVTRFARGRSWDTKDLANGWLQWQYGWRPLLSSVYDAADEAGRIVRKSLTKVSGSCTMPFRVNSTSVRGLDGMTVPWKGTGNGRQACTIKLVLTARDWDPGQWSSLNPVSLAWELIPYSFVFDWFYDIGSFLRDLESALLYNVNFQTGYVSELFAFEGKDQAMNNSNGFGFGPVGGAYKKVINVKSSVRKISFARTKLLSYPFPRKPTFKVDLGSQRLFSAASLLRQLLR